MNIVQTLIKVGLSRNEAETYMAALWLGEATITQIARKAGIPRTTCQLLVHNLKDRGLIDSYSKKKRKYWVTLNPEKLMSSWRERESDIATIIPKLKDIRSNTEHVPTIQILRGRDGIAKIFDDILGSKYNLLSFTSFDDAADLLREIYKDFIERRIKRQLPVKLLTKRTRDSEGLKREDGHTFRETRFLPDDFEIHMANFVYGNKVAMVSLNKKELLGLIIEDEEIARTHRQMYNFLWKRCAG
jgi:sugar-specific transcriptional regulator TrmB